MIVPFLLPLCILSSTKSFILKPILKIRPTYKGLNHSAATFAKPVLAAAFILKVPLLRLEFP